MNATTGEEPPAKRRKVSDTALRAGETSPITERNDDQDEGCHSTLLSRPVSPPRHRRDATAKTSCSNINGEVTPKEARPGQEETTSMSTVSHISSPIQLSRVEGLPARNNVDTVSLRDILGHPLISKCWAFNYLIDVDFLL